MKFIDLFSGIGGFHLAAINLDEKSKCVFASEIDKYCIETYKSNFNITPFGDITNIDAKIIPNHDILFAGFPCQSFSIAGKKEGFLDKTKGTLFFDILRVLKYKKPLYFILENVKNLKSHDGGTTIKVIEESLTSLGYYIDIKVLDATNFGLPQKRQRTIILGSLIKKINIIEKDKENTLVIKDIMSRTNDPYYYIDKDIIWEKEDNKIDYKKPIRIGYFNQGRQGERVYSSNGVGITLTAQGGGLSGKTGAFLFEDRIRKLLPRECARLQGFPEDFKFISSVPQCYKQLGNAVPVNIIESILKVING